MTLRQRTQVSQLLKATTTARFSHYLRVEHMKTKCLHICKAIISLYDEQSNHIKITIKIFTQSRTVLIIRTEHNKPEGKDQDE